MEHKLVLSLEFWETYGSSSLKGHLFETIPDIKEGNKLNLQFEETTTYWREQHGGPRTLIANEFMPSCFAEDMLWLFHKFDVRLSTVWL